MQLEVLATLAANDPERRRHCVVLREWFEYRGHVCMVFEKLGLSLYDFLRKNSYRPFHINLVRIDLDSCLMTMLERGFGKFIILAQPLCSCACSSSSEACLKQVRSFGRQLLESVAYLHDLALVHTDLKPENILLAVMDYAKQAPPAGSRCKPPCSSGRTSGNAKFKRE